MTRHLPDWCTDPGEIIRLLRWMHVHDAYGPLKVDTIFEVLDTPWSWDPEYREMARGGGGDSLAPLLEASLALARGAKGART
jgi:hypothetical protein